MENKNSLIQISKTLDKLFMAGFNTDKKILALKLEDLEKIPNLLSNEALTIIKFKEAVKNKQIVTFLSNYCDKSNVI